MGTAYNMKISTPQQHLAIREVELYGCQAEGDDWSCVQWNDGATPFFKLRRNNGNLECASSDGRSCIWMRTLDECERLSPTRSLACGADHKKYWGMSGYDTAGHWCSLSRDHSHVRLN